MAPTPSSRRWPRQAGWAADLGRWPGLTPPWHRRIGQHARISRPRQWRWAGPGGFRRGRHPASSQSTICRKPAPH